MAFDSVGSFEAMEQEREKKISYELLESLPEIAKSIIKDRPENKKFKENPDDSREHERKYHQYGIITHTKELIDFFETESPKAFEKWGIKDKIEEKLSEKIDGKEKSELLEISMALHDVGKFERDFSENMKTGKMDFPDYRGHESKSEMLIRENDNIQKLLHETYGLTDEQIDYVAKAAGLHYKLGEIRNCVKKKGGKYDLAFAKSEECQKLCDKIAEEFPEFKNEIGIMFFCDNMAKNDLVMGAEDDREIEKLTGDIKEDLESEKLYPKLIGGVKQIPVNLAIAEKYLKSANK